MAGPENAREIEAQAVESLRRQHGDSKVLALVDALAALWSGDIVSWNDYRRYNQGLAIDLSGLRWPDAHLIGVNLFLAQGVKADLAETTLPGCDFQDAKLKHAQLANAALGRANFRGADLSSAILKASDAREANFSRADLNGTDLTATQLVGANFIGARLQSTVVKEADLSAARATSRVQVRDGSDATKEQLDSMIFEEDERSARPEDPTAAFSRTSTARTVLEVRVRATVALKGLGAIALPNDDSEASQAVEAWRTSLQTLQAALEALGAENADLRMELALLRRENAALIAQNQALREALDAFKEAKKKGRLALLVLGAAAAYGTSVMAAAGADTWDFVVERAPAVWDLAAAWIERTLEGFEPAPSDSQSATGEPPLDV